MTDVPLHQLLESVRDAGTFLDFARALEEDRKQAERLETQATGSPYGHGAVGWENPSIQAFLEAAIAWSEDTEFGQRTGIEVNPWRKFANFLYAGKFYE